MNPALIAALAVCRRGFLAQRTGRAHCGDELPRPPQVQDEVLRDQLARVRAVFYLPLRQTEGFLRFENPSRALPDQMMIVCTLAMPVVTTSVYIF